MSIDLTFLDFNWPTCMAAFFWLKRVTFDSWQGGLTSLDISFMNHSLFLHLTCTVVQQHSLFTNSIHIHANHSSTSPLWQRAIADRFVPCCWSTKKTTIQIICSIYQKKRHFCFVFWQCLVMLGPGNLKSLIYSL